jgi:hypothetical protein
MRDIVMKDDFLKDNFLASEFRVPVTLLETNACSPLATNAIRDNIWDNFSSETYKQLPPVGNITYYHPVTGQEMTFVAPGGGRGYTRPASLISLWSTAPFLLNNTVGRFEEQPSVEARRRSFDNSIRQMLWPQERDQDPEIGAKVPLRNNLPLPSAIARTTTTSFLRVPKGYLPDSLQGLMGPLDRFAPYLFGTSGIDIGPIPKGTPVSLIANLDVLGEATGLDKAKHDAGVLKLLLDLKSALRAIPRDAKDADDQARKVFQDRGMVDELMKFSKCPDYVVNRGHYFGTDYMKEADEPGLSDNDKLALIEFLKTF